MLASGSSIVSPRRSVAKLHDVVKGADNEIRKQVLQGAFYSASMSKTHRSTWMRPSQVIRVFVSSTFTDTKFERDALMDRMQYFIREEGRKYGVQFTFMDMRTGIRDENTKLHRTLIECVNGINMCKLESMGLCFLSLQSEKYGYRPLPKLLNMGDFDAYVDAAVTSGKCSEEIKQLLYKWYVLDTNAHPSPQLPLKEIS